MHIIGAALLFTSGAAYCWAQTFTTYQLAKFNVNDKSVFTARLAISSILTLSTLLFLICGGLGYHDKTPETVLIVGNLAEWLAAWCFGLFGLTFFKEFQNLSLKVQCIPRCSGQNSDALKYSTIPVSGLDENITDSDWRSSKFKGDCIRLPKGVMTTAAEKIRDFNFLCFHCRWYDNRYFNLGR